MMVLRILHQRNKMPTKDEIIRFSELIESICYQHNIDIMDAIVYYCEENNFEVELAASLISAPLKEKMREQVEKLNLIKLEYRENRLPV